MSAAAFQTDAGTCKQIAQPDGPLDGQTVLSFAECDSIRKALHVLDPCATGYLTRSALRDAEWALGHLYIGERMFDAAQREANKDPSTTWTVQHSSQPSQPTAPAPSNLMPPGTPSARTPIGSARSAGSVSGRTISARAIEDAIAVEVLLHKLFPVVSRAELHRQVCTRVEPECLLRLLCAFRGMTFGEELQLFHLAAQQYECGDYVITPSDWGRLCERSATFPQLLAILFANVPRPLLECMAKTEISLHQYKYLKGVFTALVPHSAAPGAPPVLRAHNLPHPHAFAPPPTSAKAARAASSATTPHTASGGESGRGTPTHAACVGGHVRRVFCLGMPFDRALFHRLRPCYRDSLSFADFVDALFPLVPRWRMRLLTAHFEGILGAPQRLHSLLPKALEETSTWRRNSEVLHANVPHNGTWHALQNIHNSTSGNSSTAMGTRGSDWTSNMSTLGAASGRSITSVSSTAASRLEALHQPHFQSACALTPEEIASAQRYMSCLRFQGPWALYEGTTGVGSPPSRNGRGGGTGVVPGTEIINLARRLDHAAEGRVRTTDLLAAMFPQKEPRSIHRYVAQFIPTSELMHWRHAFDAVAHNGLLTVNDLRVAECSLNGVYIPLDEFQRFGKMEISFATFLQLVFPSLSEEDAERYSYQGEPRRWELESLRVCFTALTDSTSSILLPSDMPRPPPTQHSQETISHAFASTVARRRVGHERSASPTLSVSSVGRSASYRSAANTPHCVIVPPPMPLRLGGGLGEDGALLPAGVAVAVAHHGTPMTFSDFVGLHYPSIPPAKVQMAVRRYLSALQPEVGLICSALLGEEQERWGIEQLEHHTRSVLILQRAAGPTQALPQLTLPTSPSASTANAGVSTPLTRHASSSLFAMVDSQMQNDVRLGVELGLNGVTSGVDIHQNFTPRSSLLFGVLSGSLFPTEGPRHSMAGGGVGLAIDPMEGSPQHSEWQLQKLVLTEATQRVGVEGREDVTMQWLLELEWNCRQQALRIELERRVKHAGRDLQEFERVNRDGLKRAERMVFQLLILDVAQDEGRAKVLQEERNERYRIAVFNPVQRAKLINECVEREAGSRDELIRLEVFDRTLTFRMITSLADTLTKRAQFDQKCDRAAVGRFKNYLVSAPKPKINPFSLRLAAIEGQQAAPVKNRFGTLERR